MRVVRCFRNDFVVMVPDDDKWLSLYTLYPHPEKSLVTCPGAWVRGIHKNKDMPTGILLAVRRDNGDPSADHDGDYLVLFHGETNVDDLT